MGRGIWAVRYLLWRRLGKLGVKMLEEVKEFEAAVWGSEMGGEDLGPWAKHVREATKEGWGVGNHAPRDGDYVWEV
jgi:hypothetical protein